MKPTTPPHRHRASARTALLLASALGVGASVSCVVGTDGQAACKDLLPGDLVITEVMANPSGPDSGREWFEIYNPTSEAIVLDGFRIAASKEDRTSERSHTITALTIEPGAYLVLGSMIEEARPAFVDYGYGNGLGDLRNAAGRLAIACGDTILDEMIYVAASDGASRGFDGDLVPDASANDDTELWCDAKTAYADDALGTPGQANDPCGTVSTTTCDDGGTPRDIVRPEPGELVISEFHADPDAVADNVGEYFEIYARADVDLNGLEIGKAGEDPQSVVGASECLRVTAGEHVLFVREADSAINGGLPADALPFSTTLGNSSGSLSIASGGEVIDQISWTGSMVRAGASTNLSANLLDADANDDPASWCPSTTPYGDGDLGTPRNTNETCPGSTPAGMCEDNGSLRPVRAPAVGDFVISEVHADPDAVPDADGEYIEVYARVDLDLNGLTLGRDTESIPTTPTVDDAACRPIAAGDYALFARKYDPNDPALNGGLDPVDGTFNFALVNSNGTLYVAHEGEIIDLVTWTSTSRGAASGLDPAQLDATANDDLDNWCPQTTPYGEGDLGTPRAENDSCGPGGGGEGMCNDGGSLRMIVPPEPGDIVINEVMANPDGSTETQKEWFEIYLDADVDLNGLTFSTTSSGGTTRTLTDTDCLRFSAGDYVVLARNADPAQNAGVTTVDLEYPGAFTLTNTSGDLTLSIDGTLLDAVNWNTLGTRDGRSLSLDPGARNPADNDLDENWCDAADTDAYGPEDNAGTPGVANPPCP